MTWLEFMKIYDPEIDHERAEYLLWEWTAFPVGGIKMITYQIRSAIRASKNHFHICWACSNKFPFHSKGCPSIDMSLPIKQG